MIKTKKDLYEVLSKDGKLHPIWFTDFFYFLSNRTQKIYGYRSTNTAAWASFKISFRRRRRCLRTTKSSTKVSPWRRTNMRSGTSGTRSRTIGSSSHICRRMRLSLSGIQTASSFGVLRWQLFLSGAAPTFNRSSTSAGRSNSSKNSPLWERLILAISGWARYLNTITNPRVRKFRNPSLQRWSNVSRFLLTPFLIYYREKQQ